MPISPLPNIPRRDDPSNFAARADAFLSALPTFQAEANATALQVNQSATAASEALLARDAALSAANYKGVWSSLRGPLNVPASVYHLNTFWVLTSNVSEVSSNIPGSAPVWQSVSGLRGFSSNCKTSLNLHFALTEQMDPRIAFSRSSTATYYGKKGLLQTAPENSPRIAYNPVTGACLGFQSETAKTNLTLQSANFSSSPWVSLKAVIVPNTSTAPDGTLTASTLNDPEATAASYLDQLTSIPSSSKTYTSSVYVKKGTAQKVAIGNYFLGSSSPIANGLYTELDWASMTIISNCDGFLEDVGSDWYRLSCRITNNNSGNTQHYIRLWPSGFSVDSLVGNTYFWGAQTEESNFETSYIPTTTAQVTRAGDVASLSGENLTKWYNVVEGTVLFKGFKSRIPGTFLDIEQELFGFSNFTNDQRVFAAIHASGNLNAFVVKDAVYKSVQQSFLSSKTNEINLAMALKSGQFASSYAGLPVTSNSSLGMPTIDPTVLHIGVYHGGFLQFDGFISQFAYYPRRLSDFDLQTLSSNVKD